ncbi:MAG: hypothetical protein JNM95_06960 [Chitinophagaceae bacterium]|nr:hypothetical protein [Chitinophagaceae bacterium]
MNKNKFNQVNWMDGMKMNKNHFIATDRATTEAVRDVYETIASPFNHGLLPSELNPFNIDISVDNQQVIKARLHTCEAITSGGYRIHIASGLDKNFSNPEISQAANQGSGIFWISLIVNPFEPTPIGTPDPLEMPPRVPFLMPSYELKITGDSSLRQVLANPNELILGKVALNGSQSRVEEEYIPPCKTVSAHPDLIDFHGELDSFFAKLELKCSQIIQKIHRKNQQNELSDLVHYLCDRMLLYVGSSLTTLRWTTLHESPAKMLEFPVGLARVMKNTIDLRIGSGKEEMMNYLAEWCDVNQGELETLLTGIASIQYQHHDVNQHLNKVVQFVKILGRLFEALSNLEFIGKKKDSNIFVKEEQLNPSTEDINKPKPKRRFFAD